MPGMRKTMSEYKRGTLRSGSSKKVTFRKQAIAIAMNQEKKMVKKPKHNVSAPKPKQSVSAPKSKSRTPKKQSTMAQQKNEQMKNNRYKKSVRRAR